MVEIAIRRPIKILDSCFCTPGSNNNNNLLRKSSSLKSGLTTRNGIDFFPEEFLPDKKKNSRKSKNDS